MNQTPLLENRKHFLMQQIKKGFLQDSPLSQPLNLPDTSNSTSQQNTDDVVEKAFNNLMNEDLLEKGGEGSKGGKVIGHTKSGKPIYADKMASHKVYNDFNFEDHNDAVKAHMAHEGHTDEEKKMKRAYSHLKSIATGRI